MNEEESQETGGVLREEGMHGRPERQQRSLEERQNLGERGWGAKWKEGGLKGAGLKKASVSS